MKLKRKPCPVSKRTDTVGHKLQNSFWVKAEDILREANLL
jgi:hypothetical protein